MEVCCAGSNCKRRNTCELARVYMTNETTERVFQYIDYSQLGSGQCDPSGCSVTWHCGDNSKNYPLYKPTENCEDELLALELHKLGLSLYYTNGKRKSNTMILAMLARFLNENGNGGRSR